MSVWDKVKNFAFQAVTGRNAGVSANEAVSKGLEQQNNRVVAPTPKINAKALQEALNTQQGVDRFNRGLNNSINRGDFNSEYVKAYKQRRMADLHANYKAGRVSQKSYQAGLEALINNTLTNNGAAIDATVSNYDPNKNKALQFGDALIGGLADNNAIRQLGQFGKVMNTFSDSTAGKVLNPGRTIGKKLAPGMYEKDAKFYDSLSKFGKSEGTAFAPENNQSVAGKIGSTGGALAGSAPQMYLGGGALAPAVGVAQTEPIISEINAKKGANQATAYGVPLAVLNAALTKVGASSVVGPKVSQTALNKVLIGAGGATAENVGQQFSQNLVRNKAVDPNQALTQGLVETALLSPFMGGGLAALQGGVKPGDLARDIQASSPQAIAHIRLLKDDPSYSALAVEHAQARTAIENAQAQGIEPPKSMIDRVAGLEQEMAQRRVQVAQGGYIKNPLAKSNPDTKPYTIPKTNPTDVTKLSENELQYFGKQGYTSITDRYGNTRNITPVKSDGIERLDNLNPTGGLFVDYTPQKRATMPLADNMTTYDKTAGKAPDELVTIYRGAPKSQKGINPGDFITTNRELAQSYTGDGNVLEMQVPAKHILDDKNSPLGEEYLYRPQATKPSLLKDQSGFINPKAIKDDLMGKPTRQQDNTQRRTDMNQVADPNQTLPQAGLKSKAPEMNLDKQAQQAEGFEASRTDQGALPASKQDTNRPQIGRKLKSPSSNIKQQRAFKVNLSMDAEVPHKVYSEIPGYNVKTNAKTIGEATKRVSVDPEGVYDRLLANGSKSLEDKADALVLLRKLVENDELDKAQKLANATAKSGTDAGQAVQIFASFRKTSPDGALRDIYSRINAYNKAKPNKKPVELTTEQAKEITKLATELQDVEFGTREWAVKAAQLERAKGLVLPNSLLSKVSQMQTMAQLLNPKTFIRNVIGNTVLDIGEDLSRIAGTGLDKALFKAGILDSRNQVVPSLPTNWLSKMTGFKQGAQDVKLGIRTQGASGNYDLSRELFKPGSVGNKLEKVLGYELSTFDKAFYMGRYQSSLDNMMKAQKATTPTPEMKTIADAEALYATFQNNSAIAKVLTSTKRGLNAGKEWGVGDLILKYPKTPGNIVSVGLDYSPVGFLKGAKNLYDGIKQGNMGDIRQGEINIGRSIVGTGAIIGGSMLAKQGIITGQRDGDKDKAAADRMAGGGPFRINITALGRLLKGEDTKTRPGDITANYDWLQPNAIQLSMGANMVINDGQADKQINDFFETLGSGLDTVSEQPVFQGVTRFVGNLDTNKGGGIGKATTGLIADAPASFTPSVVNQLGQMTDNTKRNTYDPNLAQQGLNKVKARLPIARNTLEPSIDALGNTQPQYDVGGNNPLNVFLNPSFINRVKDEPAINLSNQVNQATGETAQYPRVTKTTQSVNGENVKLTAEQNNQFQTYVGKNTNDAYTALSKNDRFNSLPDTAKANLMQSLQTDISMAARIALLGHQPDKVSEAVDSIMTDNLSRAIELKLKNAEKSVAPKVEKQASVKTTKPKKVKVAKAKTKKASAGRKTKVASKVKMRIKKPSFKLRFTKAPTVKSPRVSKPKTIKIGRGKSRKIKVA